MDNFVKPRRAFLHRMLAALAVTAALPALGAQRRTALVIGNAAYRQPLLTPVGDARAVAARLRQIGFDVTLLTDIDAGALERAVAAFTVAARGSDVALLYYAGHGAQAGEAGYLLPLGATVDRLDAVRIRAEGIPVTRLSGDLLRTGAGTAIMVLDACRDEYTRGAAQGAALHQGLAAIAAPRGLAVAYSAAPGARARDFWPPDTRHSPYTGELLDALEIPGLPLGELFARVAERVAQRTGEVQKPVVSLGETSGRLVLNAGNPMAGGSGTVANAVGRAPAAAVASLPSRAVVPTQWPQAVLLDQNGEIQMLLRTRPFPRRRLEQRARGGDLVAQTALGYGLATGSAGAVQPAAGKGWLERAVAQDFPIAQAFLAELLMAGSGKAALARAGTLLEKSAAAGFAPARGYQVDLARKSGEAPEEVARKLWQAFQGMAQPVMPAR